MKYYPMKLIPAVKEIIWGGQKLKNDYGKTADFDKLAESWELTVRPDGMNTVANGEAAGQTLEAFFAAHPDALGSRGAGERFPLLIKFIDACDRLSVQVHPADDYALKNENEFGKTEMWYIVEAEEGAQLVFGVENYTPEAFDAAIREGRVEEMLHSVTVHAGDVYFIPAGLVHAIGAGILICEIQQNSNVTYRVYDYNRPGKDGKPRELHVEKAKQVIVDYTPEEIERLRFEAADKRDDSLLAACGKFTVRRYAVNGEQKLTATSESFLSLTFTEGEGHILAGGESYPICKGETWLIPAGLGDFTVSGRNVCITAEV